MVTPAPFVFHYFAEIDSTQDEVARRLKTGAPSGTVVMADVQTKGRGRQGRLWETPTGNLAATLGWKIDPATDRAEDYSLIVAIAMHRAVSSFLSGGTCLQLKWPNDLMLNAKKCAGILIEMPEPGWLLIGTGVNVAYAPMDRAKLNDHAASAVAPIELCDRYLAAFLDVVQIYHEQGLIAVVKLWRMQAYGLDQIMTVRLPTEEFTAVFRGLEDDGAARAELPDGSIRRVRSGEVFF